MEKCECNGEIRTFPDGKERCIDCGLETDSFPIDFSPIPVPAHKLRRRRLVKWRWSKDACSRNMKLLEKMAREYLPRDFAETIIYLFRETIKINYKRGIPKTRDKKVVMWVIFISWLKYFISYYTSINNKNEELASKCKELLTKIYEKNTKRFKEASKIQNEIRKSVSPDILDVDKNAPYAESHNELFRLFYKNTPQISESEKLNNIQEVKTAALLIANVFLRNILNKQLKEGKSKIKLLKKRKGLFGACCYLVCEKSELDILSQKEWASFFRISESSFDKLINELKNTIVVKYL